LSVLQKKNVPLGKLLLDRKLISEHDLWHALVAQQVSGEKLGRVLIGQGSVNSYKLHKTIAEQYGADFADLNLNPADVSLFEVGERQNYVDFSVVPWKKVGNMTYLATSDMNIAVTEWALKKYGDRHIFCITSPFDIYWAVQGGFGPQDDEEARDLLWRMDERKSAKKLALKPGLISAVAILAFLGLSGYYFGWAARIFFVSINSFYFLTLIFKAAIFSKGYSRYKYLMREPDLSGINEKDLPVYTLLVPLFKENAKVIAGLVENIRSLDYPKSKLDVKLIVESGDGQTIEAIKALKPENIFEIVRVPYSLPQTKPKAMNYALKFARGQYVTIYDAEDRPEKSQLKKALLLFKEYGEKTGCVQARLNYYNRDENILTKMFSIEYAAWFDYMLGGLDAMEIPIPLGGTSNHFPIKVLRRLYAWDPYNVTEDADLGIRLAEFGYKTRITSSMTMEEAPIGLAGWMNQRARWIKGYMQTYLVHMRRPMALYRALGWRGFAGFQLFIGAPSVVFLTIPIMLVMAAIFISGLAPLDWRLSYFALGNLIGGIVLQVIFAGVIVAKNRWWKMLYYCPVFPFYWLLHSLASFRSVYELIRRPHYWNKTEHGLSKIAYQ